MANKFLVIFALLFYQLSFAQRVEEQTDSLMNILETTTSDTTKIQTLFNLAKLNLYSNPLKTVQFCVDHVALCKKTKDYAGASNAYTLMFNAQFYFGSSADTLLHTIKQMETLVNDHLGEKDLMTVHWIYALYYENIGQTDKEIGAYIKALSIAREYDFDQDIEAALLGNIGGVLLRQEKYSEALTYLEKALKIATDDIGRAEHLYDMGLIHNHNRDYEAALKLFKESYDFYKKGKDTGGMALTSIEEGRYYDRKKEYSRANRIYFQTLDLIKTNNIGSLLPLIYVALAQHYQKQENHLLAIDYGEQSLIEIKKQKNYDNLLATYEILHESYAVEGKYKEAYDIRSQQLVYRDSVSNSELLTKVEALKTEFEVEQKDTENQLLKAQALSNQKTIQSKNIMALALCLGLLLILSWAIVVFRMNRQKQKYNNQLEAEVLDRTVELKKANKDLVQANHELQTFNHIASHDIKEPIRNIGGHVGLIYRMLPEELRPKFNAYFDTIKSSTRQLYTVVEDFSKYTQLSKEKEVRLNSVDLNHIVDNLKMGLEDYRKDKSAKIINHGLMSVETNSSMIYIILKKLIENGLKFNTSEDPTVSLSAQSHQDYVEIFVKDNGIGIEPDYQEQIFEMFKRLHDRNNFSGSGIGLAIVKLLVEKLKGSVRIESRVNKGSTFIVQLPT